VSRPVWQRGDIVVANFDPTLGIEQQGRRPAIVVTQAALNNLGMIGVCPITQGGLTVRNTGMAVSLTGTGLQTAGIVLVHQFRMIDPSQRRLSLIERAPDYLIEEVRARVVAMLE
jgi:mRNA interferase ChpB